MSTLEFLTMTQFDSQNRAKALIDRFTQSSGITIQSQFVSWENLWHDQVNISITRKNGDVSEVGSTRMSSLVEINAIKPYNSSDIARMGGQQAFIPSTWNNMRVPNSDAVWGIPVRAEPRVIWYWKDMLEAGGVDPRQAFASFDQLPETLNKLSKVSATPWAFGTSDAHQLSVHTIASWIWNAGGDFISEDGKQVRFTEPETLRAIINYFNLYRFMPRRADIGGDTLVNLFVKREVAAIIGGSPVLAGFAAAKVPPESVAQAGVAAIPGQAFMGGTALVIWQHCREYEKAVQFVQYLESPKVQCEYSPLIGYLPVLLETWKMPPFSNDPIYRIFYQALQQGRSLPTTPSWGVMEDRLVKTISQIWYELFTEKNPDTAQIVNKHLSALARRLELSLKR